MFRYIFIALVVFCSATNAVPKEKRDESGSIEFVALEEYSNTELLSKYLYLVESLGYEEDDFTTKARSAVMNKRDESGEMTSEQWNDLEKFVQAMIESGDFDEEFLMRKARDIPIEQMAKTILHN